MALSLVSNGQLSDASQLNQIIDILQRRSGQTESGKFFLAGGIYATGANISTYIPTLSRVSAPSGVTTDTADQAPGGGLNGVSTGHLSSNGFQIYATSTTGPNLNGGAGGNYTVSY